MSREDYIARFSAVAVQEMEKTGIPASITLAQGMLESDNGNSMLAREANNHFGIKCHTSWDGKRIYKDDDAKNECFRVYDSAWESFRDHSDFLTTGRRYSFLFDYKSTDYKSWAKGLRQAGYATNPQYPDLLIKIIEDNKLYEYDRGKKSPERVEEPKQEAEETEASGNTNNVAGVSEMLVKVRKSENGIKYIKMPVKQDISALARSLNMGVWQLKKYNDVSSVHSFEKGDILYLQPKKGRALSETYTSKEGDTPESISQEFGYKLNKLLRENNLSREQVLEPGTEIRFNTKRLPF